MRQLFITLSLSLLCASAAAQVKTDRDAAGLKGPVKSVRLERIEWAQDGQTIKQPRGLRSLMTFDEQGNLLETAYYKPDGSLIEKRVYMRDDAGRQVATLYNAAGQLTGKTVTIFDPAGHPISTSAYDVTGALTYKSAEIYDARGRFIGETGYNADGSPDTQTVIVYDAQNNAESAYYDARGLLTLKSAMTEQGGYVISYKDDGTVGMKETRAAIKREFDLHGNWIKQTWPRSVTQSEQTEDTIEVRYREITYYERPASKRAGGKD